SLDSMSSLSLDVRGHVWGAVMQCLACGADNKMLLMDVVRDDTVNVPVIERQIYLCSACRHIARRLVVRRAKMPITRLPVIPISIDKLWKERVVANYGALERLQDLVRRPSGYL